MSVEAATLENREKDLTLSNREKKKQEKERAQSGAEDELRALKARIASAKFKPTDRGELLKNDTKPHCGDCFARGWAAAVQKIEGV